MADEYDELKNCPICLSPYSLENENISPRILPCMQHSLCSSCLTEIMRNTPGRVVCPFDKTSFTTRSEHIPKNRFIIQHLEGVTGTKASYPQVHQPSPQPTPRPSSTSQQQHAQLNQLQPLFQQLFQPLLELDSAQIQRQQQMLEPLVQQFLQPLQQLIQPLEQATQHFQQLQLQQQQQQHQRQSTLNSMNNSSFAAAASSSTTSTRYHQGLNGKTYCGKKMIESGDRVAVACQCCNGYCGPSNGCNCLSCMRVDVESRRLPRGSLVNRDGLVATRSDETGRFYCGTKIKNLFMNGFCGPTNLPNCNACRVLDQMTEPGAYYSSLV